MTLVINVYGIVQGVGFRPFAKRIADELNLAGFVQNCNGIVVINIIGDKEALDEYVRRLTLSAPPQALITHIETKESNAIITSESETTEKFVIVTSKSANLKSDYIIPVISPDIATCDSCIEEMYDEENRRSSHYFISCTGCGPRYSIIKDIPYDRDTTTMGKFNMCHDCRKEYETIEDIRCHAQTIACRECGPRLNLKVFDGNYDKKCDETDEELCSTFITENEIDDNTAIERTIELLNNGKIVAVKDIGGYHFVCRTDDITPLRKLRELKRRQNKAFAVMFADIDRIREYAQVNEEEAKLLQNTARPIVLLKKSGNRDFYPEICGDSAYIGAMLPCNPVQMYLVNECGPLVMTSGNLGGEPIITDNENMEHLVMCKGIVSAVLSNDRDILTPLDDSIVRVFDGKCQIVRRGRGYVPLPIKVKEKSDATILASGGDLKGSFCYFKQGQAVMSQYFGDLDDMDAAGAWKSNIKRLAKLHRLKPTVLACDMHPRYYSSQISKMMFDYDKIIPVQHHHAHIASVMAEHNLTGKVLGIAFDGTGMGTDDTIWGSEVLLCEGAEFERLTHLSPITMVGGDEAAKDATLALMCYLKASQIRLDDVYDKIDEDTEKKYAIIEAAVNYSVGAVKSSSMGRLFDAVCALIGIREYNSYEGECAMALEKAANVWLEDRDKSATNDDKTAGEKYIEKIRLEYKDGVWDTIGLIKSVADIIISNNCDSFTKKAAVAYGFHKAIADAVVEYVTVHFYKEYPANPTGIPVALSGGVFMNRIIMTEITEKLREYGHEVYYNEQVPMNDGGIALGQGYVATHRLKGID